MYEKATFAKGTAASIGMVTIIGLLVMASGTAYAVPLAGVGGFTIQANEITAQQVIIYPGVDDTSGRSAMPMAVVEQKGVEIQGMKMMKTLDVGSMPGLSGNMRMVITSSKTVRADQQVVKFSNLQAKSATFNGQVVDEHDSKDPTRKFDIATGSFNGRTVNVSQDGRPAQVLKDVQINAHYLASNQISMPGMQFAIQYDSNGDGNYQTLAGSTASGSGNGNGIANRSAG